MLQNFEMFTLEVINFFHVIRYLTISHFPKKTSIWHTLKNKKIFIRPLADPHTDIVFQPTARAGAACTKTNQWCVDWLEGIEKK